MELAYRILKGIFITLFLSAALLMGVSFAPRFHFHVPTRPIYLAIVIGSAVLILLFHLLEMRARKLR